MRQLHVVALSADGRSLLLASAPKGARASYRLAVDGKLKTALRGERPNGREAAGSPDPEPAGRPESALSPREMQTRLRAGQTVEAVAKAAGVSTDRVEKYFAPVLAERIQVIDDAQATTMLRPRRGESARALGASVSVNLSPSVGVDLETVQWSARRRNDAVWIVRLEYVARARRRSAQWEWDPRERVIVPLDANASSLGYVDPDAPSRHYAPPRATSAPRRKVAVRSGSASKSRKSTKKAARSTAKRATKRTAAKRTKRTAAKRTVKRAAKRTTAKKTTKRTPKRAPAKRATATRAAKRTVKRATAKRTTAKRASAKRTTAKRATAKRATKRTPAKHTTAKRSTAKRTMAKRTTKKASPRKAVKRSSRRR